MKIAKPNVSVIVAAYNAERWIDATIGSILNQTYTNYEIIVVDDGSTDNTAIHLSQFGAKIRYFYQKNSGPAKARRFAISQALGQYIAFLDADDLWLSNKLDVQLKAIESERSCIWCYSDVHLCYESSEKSYALLSEKTPLKGGDIFSNLIASNFIPSPTPIVKADALKGVVDWDECDSLRYVEDWYIWLCLASKYSVLYIPTPLAKYRVHGAGITAVAAIGDKLFYTLKTLEFIAAKNASRPRFDLRRAKAQKIRSAGFSTLIRDAQRKTARDLFTKAVKLTPLSLLGLMGWTLTFAPTTMLNVLVSIRTRRRACSPKLR